MAEDIHPYLQLEREFVSRKRALFEAYRAIKLYKVLESSCPDERLFFDHKCSQGVFRNDEEYKYELKYILRDIETLKALGLFEESDVASADSNSNENLEHESSFVKETASSNSSTDSDNSMNDYGGKVEETSRDITPSFDADIFCYNTSFTWLEPLHFIEPEFCSRLRQVAR